MKKILIGYKILFIALTVVATSSCKKLMDINESPNQAAIENATPEVLFPNAVLSTAGGMGGQLAAVGGLWAQYFTQSATANQFRNVDSYNLGNIDEEVNLSYEELYTPVL